MEVLLILGALMFSAILVLGLYKTRQISLERRKLERIKEVMKLAERNDPLTPALLAMRTSMDFNEAEEILKEMTNQRLLEIEVTEGGTLVYLLNEFRRERLSSGENQEDG